MTFDTTPLERDCVLLNCSAPAVDPGRGKVHCAAHDPDPPRPKVIGQDPDTQEPGLPSPPPRLRLPRRVVSPHVDRQELVDLLHRLKVSVTAVERWLDE